MRDFVTLRVTDSENKKRLFECKDSASETGHRLLVTVAATHAGIVNGNMRFYRPDRMQDSAHTWVPKGRPALPVLVRHDKDSDPLGRVLTARYVDESYKYASAFDRLKNTIFYDSKGSRLDLYRSVDYVLENLQNNPSYAGLGFCELGLSITNPEAIKKVQRDEYLTVSIGFETDSAICSACHTDWAVEDKCEHRLGRMVDGKQVFLITGNFIYEEASFVNFPADPFGAVTNKQVAAAIKDSIATRAYFLGMSLRDQTQMGVYLEDNLDDLGLELDITPLVEDTMDTKTREQISAELKSDSLTQQQALDLRDLLQKFTGADEKETAKAKRALSTIRAVIKKNDWTDSDGSAATQEQVEARIAGLDALLPTLSREAQVAYVAHVESEAAAFGIAFTPPHPDETGGAPNTDATAATAKPEEAATGGGIHDATAETPATEQSDPVRALITDLLKKEIAYFDAQNKDGKESKKDEPKIDSATVLTALENLHKVYQATPENCRHLVRYATSAIVECWSAGGMVDYYKNRIAEEGKGSDAVVSRCEYDALTDSVDKYEAEVKQLTDSNIILLATSKDLARKQKVQVATSLVLVQALTDSAYAAGKSAEDLNHEIEQKSQRTLISLNDALTDAKEKLPAALKQAASAKPTEVVKEVSDNARITDNSQKVEETSSEKGDGSLDAPMFGLLDLRERRILDSQLRYQQAQKG